MRTIVVLVAPLLLTAGRGVADPLGSAARSPRPRRLVEVTGCVSHNLRKKPPTIAVPTKDRDEKGYWLVGNIQALQHAFFTPAQIRGFEVTPPASRTLGEAGPNDNGTIDVLEAKVFRPVAKMDPSFGDPSRWHEESNDNFRVRFSVPRERASVRPPSEASPLAEPSFPRQDDTETFFRATFPNLYPDSSSLGIYFSASVNRNIHNSGSCEQFGGQRPVHSLGLVSGIRYVGIYDGFVGGSSQNIHTFHDGVCYDFTFVFATSRTWASEVGCLIPVVTQEQENALIKTFLSQVHFYQPRTAEHRQAGPSAAPQVTSFTVARDEAGNSLDSFSWTSKDIDYVRLSFNCSQPVVIFGNGQSALCGEPRVHEPPNVSSNLSPNSSLKLSLTGFQKYDLGRVPVTVTLTPFSHGRAFPTSAKSLTADADAFNPIPDGIVAAKQHIELTLPETIGSCTARYPH
ncbi:MAG: hypothetical protein ACRETH_01860, partial [Steroidobacteraceae bacterium]